MNSGEEVNDAPQVQPPNQAVADCDVEVDDLNQDSGSALSILKAKLSEAESRASQAEHNMMQAAQFGKDLLQKLQSTQSDLERVQQERHQLNMRLESKCSIEKECLEEMEHLRDALRLKEVSEDSLAQVEAELEQAKISLAMAANREREAEDRASKAEEQIKEMKEQQEEELAKERNRPSSPAASNLTFSDELVQLQLEQVKWQEDELHLRNKLEKAEDDLLKLSHQREKDEEMQRRLEMELEEKECEISSYNRKLEDLRNEIQELQILLEQARMGHHDPTTEKGNSLFSEVEDRRHLVERQMSKMKAKHDAMAIKFDAQKAKLRKVKMDNLALMNQSTSRIDRDQLNRLEELLAAERAKNKNLIELIGNRDSTEGSTVGEASLANESDAVDNTSSSTFEVLPRANSMSTSLNSGENYAYLNTMLEGERKKSTELQKRLKDQMRQNLWDRDRLLELTRKVGSLEFAVSRSQTENYQLKIKLEDALSTRAKQGSAEDQATLDQAAKKKAKPPGRFEMLVFEETDDVFGREKDKENDDPIVNSDAPVSIDSGDAGKSNRAEVKKREAVSFSSFVEVVHEEGYRTEEKPLGSGESTSNKTEVKARTKPKKYNKVIYADEETKKMNENCKQQ